MRPITAVLIAHCMHPTADPALFPRRRLGSCPGYQGSRPQYHIFLNRRDFDSQQHLGYRINHCVVLESQEGNRKETMIA